MNARSRSWLSRLRRWRKAVVLAAFPALLTSNLAAGACSAMAMPAAATAPAHSAEAHTAHHSADAGAAHHHHASPTDGHEPGDADPATPCPHCRGGGALASAAPPDCASADASAGAPAPAAEHPPLPRSFTVAIAAAPLIRAGPARASPPPSSVPLNLRHCVLLV